MRTLVGTLLGGCLAAAPALTAPPGSAKTPAYDVKAEVTLHGVVEDLHTAQARADHPGLHFIVRTETEAVEVHACPVRLLKDLDFTIAKGDTVTVVGSRPGGTGIVLAREITKGQTSLEIRDKAGAPVWRR
jgi:hypothetical protein